MKIKSFLQRASVAGALLSAFALPVGAQAQYPDKPITLYVAFAAGATTDVTARALAQGAEKILGVPITVENKGGGGATVANGLLASKKPDGYSLLVTSTGSITVRPLLMKLAYTPKDFRVLSNIPTTLAVSLCQPTRPGKQSMTSSSTQKRIQV